MSKWTPVDGWNDEATDGQDRIYRGPHMNAHVLLNLLNELGKRDKIRGFPSILSLFRKEFNKFNNTKHECWILFIIRH